MDSTKKAFKKKILAIADSFKGFPERIAGIVTTAIIFDVNFRFENYCSWCKQKFRKNAKRIAHGDLGYYHLPCFGKMLKSKVFKQYLKKKKMLEFKKERKK